MTTPDEVYAFWFGPAPAQDAKELRRKLERWYQGGAKLDDEIRARFAETVEAALRGDLDGWAQTAKGKLALILVLDQFTRNLFRDTPRAFAGDDKAQQLSRQSLHDPWTPEERQFVLMPLLHSEELADQELGVTEMEKHVAATREHLRAMFAMGLEQSRKYRDVIARFGRFPHRNKALGRRTTPEEEAFLKEWHQPPKEMASGRAG